MFNSHESDPIDLSPRIVAAFTEIGVHAQVVGMGGGCEAVRISYQRSDGRFLYVGNGDSLGPDTFRVCASWIDEDSGDESGVYDTAELARFDVADILASLVAEVVA